MKQVGNLFLSSGIFCLAVGALAWNVRGVGFDLLWGHCAFQSYHLEMFKRVNVNLFSLSMEPFSFPLMTQLTSQVASRDLNINFLNFD